MRKNGLAPLVLIIVIGIVLAAGGLGLGLAWKAGLFGKPGGGPTGEPITNGIQPPPPQPPPEEETRTVGYKEFAQKEDSRWGRVAFIQRGDAYRIPGFGSDSYYQDLWFADLDGGSQTLAIKGDAGASPFEIFDWSPDSSKLLLTADTRVAEDRVETKLYYLDLKTGKLNFLVEGYFRDDEGYPSISIVDAIWESETMVWILDAFGRIWGLEVGGEGKRLVADVGISPDGSWDFSADRKKVVHNFQYSHGPTSPIYLYDFTTKQQTQLTNPKENTTTTFPYFLNAKEILYQLYEFVSEEQYTYQLMKLNLETGEGTPLNIIIDWPVWSHFQDQQITAYKDPKKYAFRLYDHVTSGDEEILNYESLLKEWAPGQLITDYSINALTPRYRWLYLDISRGSYILDLSSGAIKEFCCSLISGAISKGRVPAWFE